MPKSATKFDSPWKVPPALEQQFSGFVNQYEEEKKVRYVTSIERMGLEKGRQQGLQQGKLNTLQHSVLDILQLRFPRVPNTLVKQLQTLEDTTLLSNLLKEAVMVKSLSQFKQLLNHDD